MSKSKRKKSFLEKFNGTLMFKIVIGFLALLMVLSAFVSLFIQLSER